MSSIKDVSASSAITVALGKRKRRDSLVILLSSPAPSTENDLTYTESEHEHQLEQVSALPVTTSSSSTLKSKRHYACTFKGCIKTYTKPSRLTEHERSHTGDVRYSISSPNIVIDTNDSALLFAAFAQSPIFVKLTSKRTHAHIYQVPPSLLLVPNKGAGSDSGLHST